MVKSSSRFKIAFDVYPVLDTYSDVCEIWMRSINGRTSSSSNLPNEEYTLLGVKPSSSFEDASMNKILNRYKGTRDPISALDTALMVEFLQNSQVNLTETEEELGKIQSEADKLCQKFIRVAYKAVKREHEMTLIKSLTSSIRSFPPEILFIIFRIQVCRSWREVAINDPFLWCSHGVTIPDPDTLGEQSFPKRIALLQMVRARSENRVKGLSVHDLAQSFYQPLQHSQIMDMLFFAFRQYAHISFQNFSITWVVFTIQLPSALQSLHYRPKRDHMNQETLLPSGISTWRQHILSEYKHLEDVSLDFSPADFQELFLYPLTFTHEVIAPKTKTLSIRTSIPGDSSIILKGIQLPALKSFTYESAQYALFVPTEPLGQSNPHFRALGLYFNLGTVMSAFKSLTNLVLIRVYAIDEDIRPFFNH
ncbi:hypothetical protein CPB83DRAFT_892880 [Crepidotus variabilis]|uniref:F-box domain-containing protein n=1 Tax=Crepidotus variabilis TaxID=179855 RepID=A0A9P6EIG2_9AGAR|nr:hypothetical protein CPB83DRAFT_892880 [Crepidotus variabilis]